MIICTTQPPYEGVTNTRDHFANFSMQDTVHVNYTDILSIECCKCIRTYVGKSMWILAIMLT